MIFNKSMKTTEVLLTQKSIVPIILYSIAMFVIGPLVSLIIVFLITRVSSPMLSINDLISTQPYNLIVSMIGYPVILSGLMLINQNFYKGNWSAFGLYNRKRNKNMLRGLTLGLFLVLIIGVCQHSCRISLFLQINNPNPRNISSNALRLFSC